MRVSRLELLSVGIVAAMFAASALVFGQLPETMPIHWNIRGAADGYASKEIAAFIIPSITAALVLLLFLVKRAVKEDGKVAFERITTATVVFLGLVNAIILAVGLGVDVPVDRAMFALLGALLAVIGLWMRNIPMNRVMGVRTPWTLASEEVWTKTHRMAGPLFVICGIFMVIFSITGATLAVLITNIAVLVFVPIAYSWILSRRLS